MKARPPQSLTRGTPKRAATLMEVLVALGVGLVFLALTFSIVAMAMRMVHKNMELSDATTSTRKVQEYLTREISQAIAIPSFHNLNPSAANEYSEIHYRILVGPSAKVPADTANTSTSLVLTCPADLKPQSGDFLMLSTPDLGEDGARIVSVSDTRAAGTAGNVTVTLSGTIASLTTGTQTEVKKDATVTIQRERSFVVAAPTTDAAGKTSPICSLFWFETTGTYGLAADGVTMELKNSEGVALSSRINADRRFMFSRDPEVAFPTEEASLIWRTDYLSEKNSGVLGSLLGGEKTAYLSNSSEGRIIPKSFNPLGTGGIIPPPSTTKCTTTTSTTTSTSTSTTTSTTSTSVSTTKSTTSTSTTKSTSTTSTSTSSTKTTSTTSTSKSTTSTTKTTSTSTTSKSTTKTTSKSTTKTTSTSTTSKSTTKTTSVSTTSKSTTKPTTTTSTTSTTTKPTTVSTTSTTTSTKPTTTTSTTSTTTSTSKSTTKPTTSMVDG